MTSEIASSRVASTTLGDLLLTAADRQPDGMAIILPNQRITYAELRDQAIHRALSLHALGVEPGNHVGLLMPTGMDFVTSRRNLHT